MDDGNLRRMSRSAIRMNVKRIPLIVGLDFEGRDSNVLTLREQIVTTACLAPLVRHQNVLGYLAVPHT